MTISLIYSVLILAQSRVDDAVDFTIPDTQGNEYNLFEQFEQGKVVVLYFFSPYCGNCYYEAPILDSVYQHYGGEDGDVLVWGIAYPYATYQQIDSFKNTTGVTFPCLSTTMTEPVFYYYDVGYTPQAIVTCHYMSSGSIAYAAFEYFIEGCLDTNTSQVNIENKIANIKLEYSSIIISNPLSENIKILLTDNTGRTLKYGSVKSGDSLAFSNLDNFQLYFLVIISETGVKYVEKIILTN